MKGIDWQQMFMPTQSLLELVLRGTLMYFAILAAFRISRREAGSLAVADLLVVVLVADAAQNGMAAEYKSVTEGLVLVATIFAWDHIFDWAAYRWIPVRRLIQASPLQLVKDGKVLRQNLRRELMTLDELGALLREHGIDDVSRVKRCCLESDGQVSVIQFSDDDDVDMPRRRRGV